MIPPQINLGPITIHVYGLILGIGILAGWMVARKRSSLYKIPAKLFEDPIILIPTATTILFARLYHVLDYREIYLKDPISVLFVQNGGLGIWGGIFGAIFGVWLVAKVKRISFLNLLDMLSPPFALSQAIGRFGNWVNQEGFGPPTNLPWGIHIDQVNRPITYITNTHFHPTFFYESALDAIIFLLLIKLSKRFRRPGQVFGLYLIFYGTARFFLEFLRIDTWAIGEIKIAQVLSILAIFGGLTIFFHSKNQNKARS